uniref:Uncharacterized protein n=1 Tax=Aegilops tauschii subsp. strangulata TaxID=200361 RepID=A0A452YE66_AEGTS
KDSFCNYIIFVLTICLLLLMDFFSYFYITLGNCRHALQWEHKYSSSSTSINQHRLHRCITPLNH